MTLLQQNVSTFSFWGLGIGDIISIVSLVFAIFQLYRNKTLKRVVANDAMEIHHNVAKALGAIQQAKELDAKNQSATIEIGRAEGYSQALLYGTAKMYCFLQNLTIEQIDEMVSDQQLESTYQTIYYSYSRNEKRGLIRNLIRWFQQLW